MSFQSLTHVKLLMHILCAVIIGFLFGDSGSNANKQLSNFGSYLVHTLYLWYTTIMPGVLRCKLIHFIEKFKFVYDAKVILS